MSQTWDTIDGDNDTFAASDDIISANFATLKSMFSGASAPSSPVQGQCYVNTSDDGLYFYTGTEWKLIGYTDTTYGGLLPLTAGSSYPISGDLYMATGKRIKNVTDPTADGDVATKGWVRDSMIDVHNHQGATGEGDKIHWKNGISPGSDTGNTILQINSGATSLENRHFGAGGTTGSVTLSNSWTTLATASVWKWSLEKAILHFGIAEVLFSGGTADVQVARNGTVVWGPMTLPVTASAFSYASIVTAPEVVGSPYGVQYTWTLQGKLSYVGAPEWIGPWLLVM